MPENIFSYYNSCAFSVDGQGEFEVDVSIDVDDLTEAGYFFGVNYYGDPIAKDAKGEIRKIHFSYGICKSETCGKYCRCKHESIDIGGYHPLQTNKIFNLNTNNRIVGMKKPDKRSLWRSIQTCFPGRCRVYSAV